MANRGAAVAVEALDVAYGATQVLRGVSLDIAPGTFVALIGSSGCGKTTLLRAISGFIEPRAGRIRLDGKDITALPPEQRGMAMVFQSYALWPHMTVAQNIGYGLKLRGVERAARARKVGAILDLLQLEGYGARKVTALSGGQRQRVALGRALAVDPPVLLLDEPLSNLDAKIRLAMRHEIKRLHAQLGMTAIHVTHDQEEAMTMADEIVILNKGEIVQRGAPEFLYKNPNSLFVASFLGADNTIAGDILDEGRALRLASGETLGLETTRGARGPSTLLFRSDAVRLGAPVDAGGGLRLEGRVSQRSYPGGRWRYEIETTAGRFLVDEDRRLEPGERVPLSIPDDDLYIFASPANR